MNEEIIKNARINENVELPEGRFESVKFDESDYGDGYRFSWTAKSRGREGYWATVFPYGKTSNTVAVFKTLAGAKRNFFKRQQ